MLNDWAARDLAVQAGDPLTLEYYVWEEPGRLVTRIADFHVAAIVPIAGAAADRDLAPVYPGITEAAIARRLGSAVSDRSRRVRPTDEEYWKQYRTTPKAFVPFEVGQRAVAYRATAIAPRSASSPPAGASPADALGALHDASPRRDRSAGDWACRCGRARARALAASRGATDFGEYFTYFSFFLVASALLLAVLFFRLGVEQRAREVGLLRAVGSRRRASGGCSRRRVAAGGRSAALIGIAGAIAYAGAMMAGLGTWWVGAVGDRRR